MVLVLFFFFFLPKIALFTCKFNLYTKTIDCILLTPAFCMFQFINSYMQTSNLGPKLEEEVPKLFKSYGYPNAIAKSAMYTVGTPHTWPILLAALHWFKDQVEVCILR